MILSLLLSLSTLSLTLRPPTNASFLVIVAECENGWGMGSVREVEGKAIRFETRGRPRGTCTIEVRAVDKAGNTFKIETREAFAPPEFP